MRAWVDALLLTSSLPLASPPAAACHPAGDPPTGDPVAAWHDHGCGGEASWCVAVHGKTWCHALP